MPMTPSALTIFNRAYWEYLAHCQQNSQHKTWPRDHLFADAPNLSSIPSKKLSEAKASFVNMAFSDERVLLLYHDKFMFFSSANGLALTDRRLYAKRDSDLISIDIQNLESVQFEKEEGSSTWGKVSVNGKSFQTFIKEFRICALLSDYFDRLIRGVDGGYEEFVSNIANPGAKHPLLKFLDEKWGEGELYAKGSELARVDRELIYRLISLVQPDEVLVSFAWDVVFSNYRVIYGSTQIPLTQISTLRFRRRSKHKHSHTSHALLHTVKHPTTGNVFAVGLSLLNDMLPEHIFDIYVETLGGIHPLRNALEPIYVRAIVDAAAKANVNVVIEDAS